MAATSWTERTGVSTIWDDARTGALLKEDGFFLLLETDDQILLEQGDEIETSWTERTPI